MSSNSVRTKQQLATIPVMLGGIALIIWPISWKAAQATGWITTGTFTDFWFGAAAVFTFVGAAAATIGCAITAIDAVWQWARE